MLWGSARLLHDARKPVEALRAFRAALARAPDVGAFANHAGFAYAVVGDLVNARACLEPFARQGMVDDENWSLLGSVDFQLGRLDEAAAAVRRAIALYPTSRSDLEFLLAGIEIQRAERALREERWSDARRSLDAARGALADLPLTMEAAELLARIRSGMNALPSPPAGR
jgi:tetratricopeptide (TPR) repeat protein